MEVELASRREIGRAAVLAVQRNPEGDGDAGPEQSGGGGCGCKANRRGAPSMGVGEVEGSLRSVMGRREGRAEFTSFADLKTASWEDLRSPTRIGIARVVGRVAVAAGRLKLRSPAVDCACGEGYRWLSLRRRPPARVASGRQERRAVRRGRLACRDRRRLCFFRGTPAAALLLLVREGVLRGFGIWAEVRSP